MYAVLELSYGAQRLPVAFHQRKILIDNEAEVLWTHTEVRR